MYNIFKIFNILICGIIYYRVKFGIMSSKLDKSLDQIIRESEHFHDDSDEYPDWFPEWSWMSDDEKKKYLDDKLEDYWINRDRSDVDNLPENNDFYVDHSWVSKLDKSLNQIIQETYSDSSQDDTDNFPQNNDSPKECAWIPEWNSMSHQEKKQYLDDELDEYNAERVVKVFHSLNIEGLSDTLVNLVQCIISGYGDYPPYYSITIALKGHAWKILYKKLKESGVPLDNYDSELPPNMPTVSVVKIIEKSVKLNESLDSTDKLAIFKEHDCHCALSPLGKVTDDYVDSTIAKDMIQ